METNRILKQIFDESELTQQEFADEVDLSKPRLNQMLLGVSEVKFSTLQRVAKKMKKNIKIVVS